MRTPYTLIVVAVMVLGTGCGANLEYQAFYEDYERNFRQRVSYVEHRVVVDEAGHQLYAREFGTANRGSGPLVVLMHGFPDSLHLYDRLVPLLAVSHHVVAFDFLGWGQSDKPEGMVYGFAGLRRDLQAIVAYFRAEEVVLVVHDLSGLPGIDWALEHEAQTRLLVLLNTVYSPVAGLRRPEAIERYATPGRMRDIQVWLAQRGDGPWQKGVEGQLAKFLSEQARATFLKLFVHQALGIRDAFFALNRVLAQEVASKAVEVPRLRQFTKPVHIIFGADDPYLTPQVAQGYHALFAESQLSLVHDAGHYVQLDQPERVATLILQTIR